MHRLTLLVFFILILGCIFAQDSTVVYNAEEISLDLYRKKDWKQLIKFSERYVKQNPDYFYLRLRLGIAYFELKKYRTALYHFEKANQMNNEFELLKEYLYYCYLFTQQYPAALKTSERFSEETKKKTKTDEPPLINFANTEYGMKFSSDETIYKPMNYFQFGFGFRLGRDLTAYNAYSYINQNVNVNDGTVSQHQYYLNLNIPAGKSWSLMPAIHFINLIYTTNGSSVKSTPINLSFAAEKNFRDFSFLFGASVSNINPGNQIQQHLEVTYYPFHNNSFSINAGTIIFTDSIFTLWSIPIAGTKYFITPHFSASLNYLYAGIGNTYGIPNFSEKNGYLVSNSPDPTHHKINLLLDWNCYKNLSFYTVLLYESKTENLKKLNYNYKMALAGIKFIF